MFRYLIVIVIVTLCCGFNLCEKKVRVDGRLNRIYIYPDCNDTSCYLKQRYQANHVVEYLYINSTLRYKRILDKTEPWIANEYIYDSTGKHEVHNTDTLRTGIPDKLFSINDSCSLNIEYYNDGGYHICTFGFDRRHECLHPDILASTIVFDSAYAGKMEGKLQILCDTNTITDAFSEEEVLKIVHRERQTGLWYIYNGEDHKTDSIAYKPR